MRTSHWITRTQPTRVRDVDPALDAAVGLGVATPVVGAVVAALSVGGKDRMSADLPPNPASLRPEPGPEHTAASDGPAHSHVHVSQSDPDAVVLTVAGELDAAGLPRLSELLWDQLMSATGTLVMDLSAVEFLGVDALELLNQAQLRAAARGLAVRVVATGHEARHALHVAGLDALCRDTVTEALGGGPHPRASSDETGQGV